MDESEHVPGTKGRFDVKDYMAELGAVNASYLYPSRDVAASVCYQLSTLVVNGDPSYQGISAAAVAPTHAGPYYVVVLTEPGDERKSAAFKKACEFLAAHNGEPATPSDEIIEALRNKRRLAFRETGEAFIEDHRDRENAWLNADGTVRDGDE